MLEGLIRRCATLFLLSSKEQGAWFLVRLLPTGASELRACTPRQYCCCIQLQLASMCSSAMLAPVTGLRLKSSLCCFPAAQSRTTLGYSSLLCRHVPYTSICHTSCSSSANSEPATVEEPLVRRASYEDVQALAKLDALCHANGSAGWSLEAWKEDTSPSSPRIIWVYEAPANSSADSLSGFVAGAVVVGEIQLENLAVHPVARGKGIAKSLCITLLRRCRCHLNDCILEVKEGNMAAVALYTGLGFQQIARRKKYYEDGADALVMRRPAGPL